MHSARRDQHIETGKDGHSEIGVLHKADSAAELIGEEACSKRADHHQKVGAHDREICNDGVADAKGLGQIAGHIAVEDQSRIVAGGQNAAKPDPRNLDNLHNIFPFQLVGGGFSTLTGLLSCMKIMTNTPQAKRAML